MGVDGGRVVRVVLGLLDPLVGRGLLAALNGDVRVRVVGVELGGSELLRCADGLSPGVIVVGDSGEYALLADLKARLPDAGLLVLGRPSRLAGTLLLALSIACVASEAPVLDIVEAIYLTGCGHPVFLTADGQRGESQHVRQWHLLTPREREVLKHLSRGESAAEIALALRRSPATIRSHTSSIRRKLDVSSKRELIGIQPAQVGR
jgi:DNA-binding CsgD family transcriptional regulator